MPTMTRVMKIPEKNCLKKLFPDRQSHVKMSDRGEAPISRVMVPKSQPIDLEMMIMVSTTAPTMNRV